MALLDVISPDDFYVIMESDAPYAGQAMAIGIEPMQRDKIKSVLRDLRLIK